MQHSTIVGGSTAKRVMNCPGSVALVAKMPPQPSSSYADEGTLLHDTIAQILDKGTDPSEYLGAVYNGVELTQELIDTKLIPALELLNEIDPESIMEFSVENRVGFGDRLPGVFGSTDLLCRVGNRAIVLDWKFGDGVTVEAEESEQLMFYAAAATRTEKLDWWAKGAETLELVIVQPPNIRRWETTFARIVKFEKDLVRAVKVAKKPDAPLASGDWCRWCAAKPVCPVMTGALDRVRKTQIDDLDAAQIGEYLQKADMLEDWIKSLRELAFQMLEAEKPVPGYKLVAKRAQRKWRLGSGEVFDALAALGLTDQDIWEPEELRSRAQIEKVLKKQKLALPDNLVESVSSGNTLAPEADPRPAALTFGPHLRAALSKLS
jgi:hypothetical protein